MNVSPNVCIIFLFKTCIWNYVSYQKNILGLKVIFDEFSDSLQII